MACRLRCRSYEDELRREKYINHCEVVTWHHLHTRPSQYGCGYGLELVWIRASLQDFAYIDSYPYPTR